MYQSLLRILTPFLLALFSLGTLSSCAKYIPPYVSPELRNVANQEGPWPANHYLVLAYHGVQDDTPDQTFLAVRSDQLVAHMQWLRKNGYQAVSIDQILAAQKGGPALPQKAVLLSFDDGYRDFLTRVLPILEAYQWPAVMAPVGTWLETPDGQNIDFGGKLIPRSMFLTRSELAQVAKSKLVEVGSHTYDQHKGILANPQGNLLPAMANRYYFSQEQRYETTEEFEKRLRDDINAITKTVQTSTGKKPRVWVWPYGAINGVAQRLLKEAGYELFLTLESGLASVANPDNVPRMLMSGQDDIQAVAQMVTGVQERANERVVHIDLDYVYDPDPEQINKNLDVLVQRIKDMHVSTVYLQAFSDPQGDGLVREVYFPNRVLPVRADLFNRVAWQLKSRGGVSVYAWMPVLSLNLDASYPRVQRWDPQTGAVSVDPKQYQRLTPFNTRNRETIGMLYEDLASYASFAGVIFHDDAMMSDFEDVSADALQAYAVAGLPTDIAQLRQNPETMQRWTRFKSKALIDFTHELTAKVRAIRGVHIKTARNIFAGPVLEPESEAWYAQNYEDFLKAYDWTAPMVMPLMEGVSYEDAPAWLDRMVDTVRKHPGALQRTVFELQTKDWRSNHGEAHDKPIDSKIIASWMRRLQLQGALSFGYYPDDFVQNHPALETVVPYMSTTWFPAP